MLSGTVKGTARLAREKGFDAFSSTLLSSIWQKHESIAAVGREVETLTGVPFYYRDFRTFYREGLDEARRREYYTQPYCGCVFSEYDRYEKKYLKEKNAVH